MNLHYIYAFSSEKMVSTPIKWEKAIFYLKSGTLGDVT